MSRYGRKKISRRDWLAAWFRQAQPWGGARQEEGRFQVGAADSYATSDHRTEVALKEFLTEEKPIARGPRS